MSSPVRSIQRAQVRGKFFGGRGSKLGVRDDGAKDLLARLRREKRRSPEPVKRPRRKKDAVAC